MAKGNARLVALFEGMAQEEGYEILRIEAGGEAICVHPLADEFEVRAKLGVSAEDYDGVDFYWRVAGDVVFVEVISRARVGIEPGLYARLSEWKPRHINLVAVVSTASIDAATIQRVAEGLWEARWVGRSLTRKLTRLGPEPADVAPSSAVQMESYLKAGNRFVPVSESKAFVPDPNYIEGAIKLSAEGVELLTLEMWDYVDQLWEYLVDLMSEVSAGREAATYFPDQPIRVKARPVRGGRGIEVE